ncbi:hypothetical protein NCCP2222_34940 [Sporosarcina sp. NCCP-2222]|uniref:ATP-grasp domain-containing protein n=1 Tax=Sporosarcina sp. NCCP-2222 TaxID=2935073 RepID=UPI0020835E81|nr:ATP-grasp domain-containing protein [Sporosarcina sp. NCCP-2222]GKV57547.1 hypothetical protein NCCP2222_34940 [Sporosarcina sp. NCCP-2222]
MTSIVFIESVQFGAAKDALEASKQLGYTPILLTEKRSIAIHALEWGSTDLIYHIDLTETRIRDVLDHLRKEGHHLQAVISFVDPYVSLAARLSNEYCQTDLSADALGYMENKIHTRHALASLGVNPIFSDITEELQPAVSFPAVIKSSFSKGSRDVYYVRTAEELATARYKLTSRHKDTVILLEAYMEGSQYIVEVVVRDNLPHIVAVAEQDVTNEGKFIVTGYSIGNILTKKEYDELLKVVGKIVGSLHITNAAFHLEMRLTSQGWKLIELNPRMAGFTMNQMIDKAYGINLAKETVRFYAGQAPNLTNSKERAVYTYCMTTELYGIFQGVSGIEESAAQPGVVSVELLVKAGDIVGPAMSMGQRYGYVMASGDSVELARERAMEAARLIVFYIEEI